MSKNNDCAEVAIQIAFEHFFPGETIDYNKDNQHDDQIPLYPILDDEKEKSTYDTKVFGLKTDKNDIFRSQLFLNTQIDLLDKNKTYLCRKGSGGAGHFSLMYFRDDQWFFRTGKNKEKSLTNKDSKINTETFKDEFELIGENPDTSYEFRMNEINSKRLFLLINYVALYRLSNRSGDKDVDTFLNSQAFEKVKEDNLNIGSCLLPQYNSYWTIIKTQVGKQACSSVLTDTKAGSAIEYAIQIGELEKCLKEYKSNSWYGFIKLVLSFGFIHHRSGTIQILDAFLTEKQKLGVGIVTQQELVDVIENKKNEVQFWDSKINKRQKLFTENLNNTSADASSGKKEEPYSGTDKVIDEILKELKPKS